ncbi:MAG: metalloregulator ArsR/SmtB family transcription factor [Thermoplasmata archaeon]|nr:metalloregulator ArsR/SmtB family transcription factor [Thermoplasmata archaeon]
MALDDERQAHRLAEVFAALSNPRRVVILSCLLEGEKSVGDLWGCERLQPSSQPNMSQHLSILRKAGLVRERRDGARVLYRVASPQLKALVKAGIHLTDEQLVVAR